MLRKVFTLDWSGLLWITPDRGLQFEGFSGFLWVLMGSHGFGISAVAALPPSPGDDATRLARRVRFEIWDLCLTPDVFGAKFGLVCLSLPKLPRQTCE